MSTRCHVATRKGLFTLDRGPSGWSIAQTAFVGDNCTLVMHDARGGDLIAALNHGHFGIKMHRSRDGGASWNEIAAPQYPARPADYTPKAAPLEGKPADWSLKLVWALAPGGVDEPGVVWCGTLPGGLFRSEDGGDSWTLNRALWDDPLREEWFGGGADHPGIHSICVDPRDARRVDDQERWRHMAAWRPWDARRVHAARARVRAECAGPASSRAVQFQSGCAVSPASQRDL